MRVGLLTANASEVAEALIDDPHRGELYELACIIGSAPTKTIGVPRIPRARPPRNLRVRERYDRETASLLKSHGVESLFVAGYPWALTEPMLDAFPNRITAVHDGDLTKRDEFGQRRWTGLHAVLQAILAGEQATRTSLFIVTGDLGQGPLLLVGPRHPVSELAKDAVLRGDYETAASYARLHRAWMRCSWGALIRRAIEILAVGTVQIVGDTAWIDGVPGPCRLGEAPDRCEELEQSIHRGVPAWCPFVQPREERA